MGMSDELENPHPNPLPERERGPDGRRRVLDGYAARTLDSGAKYHVLHYSADPEKDEEWADEALRGIPPSVRRREYELDENVSEGTPFWEDYVDSLHCIKKGRVVPIIPGALKFGGWDCGTSRMPAFELCQITPKSKQVQWIGEVVPDRPMAMETFAPKVRAFLKAKLPGEWNTVRHVGDATVTTKSGSREKSTAQDVAKEYGMFIKPISNAFKSEDGREASVIRLLTDHISAEGPMSEWMPRMIYSEEACPVLVAGMRGAYCVSPTKKGDDHGPGAIYEATPAKNWFSHSNDAHQYPCVHLHKLLLGGSGTRKSYRRI